MLQSMTVHEEKTTRYRVGLSVNLCIGPVNFYDGLIGNEQSLRIHLPLSLSPLLPLSSSLVSRIRIHSSYTHTTAPPPEVIKLSPVFHHSQLTDLPKRDFASRKSWIILDSLIPALPTEKGNHSPFWVEPPAHQVTTGILIR